MDQDFAFYVGYELRKLREGTGLSVAELAKEVGVSAATISAWESGRSNLSLNNFRKICTNLGDHPSDVLRRIEQQMLLDF